MDCEPEGCGPKSTCLATSAKARFPSKPPVASGAGVFSSGCCFGVFAAALTTGAAPEGLEASLELQATKKDSAARAGKMAMRDRNARERSRSGFFISVISGISIPCRRGLGGELFVFVADDDPGDAHAYEIQTKHRRHEDEHGHGVGRRRDDGCDDRDDGDG